MAANICMRNGPFELFSLTSPGTSDLDHIGAYWKDIEPDNNHTKFLCLDSSPVDQHPHHQHQHHQRHHQQQQQQQQQSHHQTPQQLHQQTQQSMAVCAGCRLEIADRYFLRVNPNLEFHAHCLKCVQCARPLDENQTAFVRDGQTYCRDDYRSLFSTRCTRCQGEFDKTDLVMKAGIRFVFHLDCFACVACEKRLQTGEEFQIKNNSLYCRADCDCAEGVTDVTTTPGTFGKLQSLNNNNSSTNANTSSNFDEDEWDEERSTLTSLDNNTSSPLGSPKSDGVQTPVYQHNSGGSSSSCSKKKKDKQATRVRTVLNEQQLKILKDCYSVNSRPDTTLKERLVEMTGLNARVIRVWFQNKRCKDKKRQIQITETRLNSEREEVLNRVRVNGIGPLMVQPGTPHIDNSLVGGPLDIQHFARWSSPPPPQQFGNPMMFNSPVEMPPFGVTPIMAPVAPIPITPSEVLGPPGAAVFPHYSPQHGAPLTATAHEISSPTSCSE